MFKPIGQKAVYKAAAKKTEKGEEAVATRRKVQRIFYRLNNEVVGIESIPLNKIYFNVFGLKWSTPFIHHRWRYIRKKHLNELFARCTKAYCFVFFDE